MYDETVYRDAAADAAAGTAIVFLTIAAAAVVVHLLLALVVYHNARRLGAARGRLGGGLLDMGPAAWFVCVAVFGPPAAWLWATVRGALHAVNVAEAAATRHHSTSGPLGRPWPCTCGRSNAACDTYCGGCGTHRDTPTYG